MSARTKKVAAPPARSPVRQPVTQPLPPASFADRLRRSQLLLFWLAVLLLSLGALYVRLGSAPEGILEGWFNSDWLFSAQVYQDLFVDRFPLSTMSFPTAPSVFPDIALCVLVIALVGHPLLGTLLYGMLQYLLLVAGFQLCGSAIGGGSPKLRNSLLYAAAVAIVLQVALSKNYGTSYLFFLFLPTTHMGSITAVMLSFAIALFLLRDGINGRRAHLLLGSLAIVSLLSALSDLMFIAYFVVPLTGALSMGAIFRLVPLRRAAIIVAVPLTFAIAGWKLKDLIFRTTPLHPSSPDLSTVALHTLLSGLNRNFAALDPLHLWGLLFVASSLVTACVLLYRHIRPRGTRHPLTQHEPLLICFLISQVVAAIVSLIAPVWIAVPGLSLLKNYEYSMKYMFPFFICPLFAWPVLASYWWSRSPKLKSLSLSSGLRWLAAVAVLLVPLSVLALAPKQTHPIHSPEPPFELVRVLDRHAGQMGLKYGLGGFWETRWVNLLSQKGLRAFPVTNWLEPYGDLTNASWYAGHPASRHPNPTYSFFLLNGTFYNLSRDLVTGRFGPPVYEFLGGTTRILAYSPPVSGVLSCHASQRQVELSTKGETVIPAVCLPGLVGTADRTGRTVEAPGVIGYLSYGPYIHLPQGSYSASLDVEAYGQQQTALGTWDVVLVPGYKQLRQGAITAGTTRVSTQIKVDADPSSSVEFRVLYNGVGRIKVKSMTFKRLSN